MEKNNNKQSGCCVSHHLFEGVAAEDNIQMERVYATNGLWLNGFADDDVVNTISELMSGAAGVPVRAGAAKCTVEVKGREREQKREKKEPEVQKKKNW